MTHPLAMAAGKPFKPRTVYYSAGSTVSSNKASIIEHSREFEPVRSPSIRSGVSTPPLARRMRNKVVKMRPSKSTVMVDSSSNGGSPELYRTGPPQERDPLNDSMSKSTSSHFHRVINTGQVSTVKRRKNGSTSLKRSQTNIRRVRSSNVARTSSTAAKNIRTQAVDPMVTVPFLTQGPTPSPLPVHPPPTSLNVNHEPSMLLIRSKSTSRGIRASPIRQFFAKFFKNRRWRLVKKAKAALQRRNANKKKEHNLRSKSALRRKRTYKYTKEDLDRQLSFEVMGSGYNRSERFRTSKFSLAAFHPTLKNLSPSPVSSSYSQRLQRPSNLMLAGDRGRDGEVLSQLSSSADDRSDSSRLSDSTSAVSSLSSSTSGLHYYRSNKACGDKEARQRALRDISARQGSRVRRLPSLKAPKPIRLHSPHHIYQLDQKASSMDLSPRVTGAPRLSRGISKKLPAHPILRRKEAYSRLGKTNLLDVISISSRSSAGYRPGAASASSYYTSGSELEEAIEFVDTWSQYLKRAIAVRVVLRQEIHSWEEQNEENWRRSIGISSTSDTVFSTMSNTSPEVGDRGQTPLSYSCSTCTRTGSCSCTDSSKSCSRAGSYLSSENWQRGAPNPNKSFAAPAMKANIGNEVDLNRNSSIRAVGHNAGPIRLSERKLSDYSISTLPLQTKANRAAVYAPIWFKDSQLDHSQTTLSLKNYSDWSGNYGSESPVHSSHIRLTPGSSSESANHSEMMSGKTSSTGSYFAHNAALKHLHHGPTPSSSSVGSPTATPLKLAHWPSAVSLNRASSVSSSSIASNDNFGSATHIVLDLNATGSRAQIPRKVTGPRPMRPELRDISNISNRPPRAHLGPSPMRNSRASTICVPKRRWSVSSGVNNSSSLECMDAKSLATRPLPPIPGRDTRSVSMPSKPLTIQEANDQSPPRPIRRSGAHKRRAISNNLSDLGSAWNEIPANSNFEKRSFGPSDPTFNSGRGISGCIPLSNFPLQEEDENIRPYSPSLQSPGSPANPIVIS